MAWTLTLINDHWKESSRDSKFNLISTRFGTCAWPVGRGRDYIPRTFESKQNLKSKPVAIIFTSSRATLATEKIAGFLRPCPYTKLFEALFNIIGQTKLALI